MIAAKILADSFCTTRLTTFLVTAPRVILAEINTHRMLSRNSASSRAIPVARKIAQVRANPFVPTFWGENRPGMQADIAVGAADQAKAVAVWERAAKLMAECAEEMVAYNVHKQIANRLLEAFTWQPQLITMTEYGNFFNLRVHAAAEPLFHELAGQMLRALRASTPAVLEPGDWHIPFGEHCQGLTVAERLQVASGRAARLSYEQHDGTFSLEADQGLADRLVAAGHNSPVEHSAQAIGEFAWGDGTLADFGPWLQRERAHWDGKDIWWGNFRWWKQYRKTFSNENQAEFDMDALLADWEVVREARGY